MIYLMSDIHGNAKAYFSMKKKIKFDENDHLYVLGDILDGNSKKPEACLKILDDIMEHENITLIVGDHEYTHVMYQMTRDEKQKKAWEKKLREKEFSGDALMKYMDNLSEKERMRYLNYLALSNVSKLINVGERFFYLVHGAPALMEAENCIRWSADVVESEIDIEKDYTKEIKQDPFVELPEEIDLNEVIIACGSVVPSRVLKKLDKIFDERLDDENGDCERVYMTENKMLINCGCSVDRYHNDLCSTLACVGLQENEAHVWYMRI